MRQSLLAGLTLAVAAALAVVVGSWLELEFETSVLVGVGAGAAVALVPHATAGGRLGAFAAGVLISFVMYIVRAQFFPDSTSGLAVVTFLTIALLTAVAVLTVQRLPLWALLLGMAAFAGPFESIYSAEPPRVLDNGLSLLSTVAFTAAVGFAAAAAFVAQRHDDRDDRAHRSDSETDGNFLFDEEAHA